MLPLFKSRANKKELTAGPDLDREVARLLGIHASEAVPRYSTDDRVAVALAEWFSREWGWWHYKKREVYGGWTVGWIEEKQPMQYSCSPIQSSGPTRPLAICRSILKVVESVKERGDRTIRSYRSVPELQH